MTDTDAAGRRGVGVRRVDRWAFTATERVFDRKHLTYLGERSYLTEDGTRQRRARSWR
ncbi:hypothetical protein [Streptomyces sp. NPDC058424]|uniref:hypothetical protein n=1 Tax=Streptomyces sp. NPDC058424 TaxID=3346491 RepID=UPI003649468D